MITVNNLSVYFTGIKIFDKVSFVIGDNERIGLTGKNGAGKSTLLNILAGHLPPETGNIVITSGYKIGYLPQEKDLSTDRTVWDETMNAFVEIRTLEKQLEEINQRIMANSDYHSPEYTRLLDDLSTLNNQYAYLDAANMEADTERVLIGLGFRKNDFHRSLSTFSSGWQMRVELAKILLRKTEIILLDEPTNHLDIESVQWLETFLQSYSGCVIMVSHDRRFLDAVCKRTIEITLGSIVDYNCNYSEYVVRRAERITHQKSVFDNQQKTIADTEKFIERFRYKSSKAKQVQSKIKLLDKLDIAEVDDLDTSHIHFLFAPAPPADRVLFEAENLSKAYSEKPVLHNLSFVVQRKEKIAFVGRNGEGKTTLIRLLQQELQPTSGILRIGSMVKTGYYAQTQNTLADTSKTVFQTIDDVATGNMRAKVRNILGGFLFGNDDIEKKVSVLSGGEKARLALAKLLLEPYNVLILDEPTNHLDMQSKDVLKNALLRYDGALILVSHDRDFLQGLTDKVFEFKNGTIKEYLGDIDYYLQKRSPDFLQSLKIDTKQTQSIPKNIVPENKNDWKEQKQQDRLIRKLEKQITQLEEIIQSTEQNMEEICRKLADTEHYRQEIASGDLYKSYMQQQIELEQIMSEWETLSLQLEEMKKNRI